MQLLPCKRPAGPLETAPRTSLCVDSVQERWEGFWSVEDDGYYTRCVRSDAESWFRIVDEPARARVRDARVLPLRPRGGREFPITHRMVLLTPADGSRAILVGGVRRAPRAEPRSVEADR